jgi:tetratricopeptide (TPR) repeat protein
VGIAFGSIASPSLPPVNAAASESFPATLARMSPRRRVVALVAALAAVAAVLAVAVAVGYAPDEDATAPVAQAPKPRTKPPPLAYRFPLRADAEARDLLRGATLLSEGERARARRLFVRYDSIEAKIGRAFADWPAESVERLIQLAGLYPRSAVVQLHLGLALYWANQAGAEDAWREAREAEPDSPYAVVATDLLNPESPPGVPIFVPSRALPPEVRNRPAPEQLELLRRLASQPSRDRERTLARTLYLGVALQRAGRQLSARAVFDEAARIAPTSPDARVAAAVGRFDKERPAEAFGRLGPLTRRFPHAATVRFHLGLLLLWRGQVEPAIRQLRLARSVEPGSPLAHEATRWLDRLEAARRR